MPQKKLSYLLFEVENQFFALDVKSVIKIQELEKVSPIPSSPENLYGIIEFDDNSVPLINLKHIFNFKNTKKRLNLAIVSSIKLNNETVKFAISVDNVRDIINIDENEIKEVPKLYYNINIDYLSGIIKLDKDMVYILRIQNILELEEQEKLVEIIANNNKQES